MSNTDVSKLIGELKNFKSDTSIDEAERKKLYNALSEASQAIETPLESVNRISFSPLLLAVSKVAADLDLFAILEKSSAPSMNTEQLAQATGAKPVLLVRLLRYLASLGAIEEVAEEQFAASKLTKTLAQPGFQAGIIHTFDSLLPCWQALPKFLAGNKYDIPSDNAHTAFQIAHDTDLPAFSWALKQGPHRAKNFSLWMQANKAGLPTWLDVVPFKDFCSSTDSETPIFVDVGGSIGHQCAALKAKYPDIPGRVIYQDLPPVIPHGLKIPGVEPMVHDFWQEQPIKGARIYYLRNILHDYPDEKCVTLLQNTAAAMSDDSLIFIDEMILSNSNASFQAAAMDLNMMITLAGAERTDKQWRALTDTAGLTIKEIFTYNQEVRESILVLARK